MLTGPVGPVEVFFYWPEAVLGIFTTLGPAVHCYHRALSDFFLCFSDEDQVSQSSQDGSLSGSRDSSMERDWSGAGWSETRGSSDNSPEGALPGDDGKHLILTPLSLPSPHLYPSLSLSLSLSSLPSPSLKAAKTDLKARYQAMMVNPVY